MGKKSFDIFDLNNNGKVDPWERDLEYTLMAAVIMEQEQEERRQQEQMDRELDELMDEIFSTPNVSAEDFTPSHPLLNYERDMEEYHQMLKENAEREKILKKKIEEEREQHRQWIAEMLARGSSDDAEDQSTDSGNLQNEELADAGYEVVGTVTVDDVVKELELEEAGLDKTELFFMDDFEREEALEEAGLDPDVYSDFDFF